MLREHGGERMFPLDGLIPGQHAHIIPCPPARVTRRVGLAQLHELVVEGVERQLHVKGMIVAIVPEDRLIRVTLSCGIPLVALITWQAQEQLNLQPGDPITAVVKATSVHIVARTPGIPGYTE